MKDTNLYEKLFVRIHSRFAAACPSAIKLWYFCRAISDNGVAKFNINNVSALFKRTNRTIRSWLAQGLDKGYYRHVSHDNKGNYTVYYSSLFKLTKNWGYVTELDIDELVALRPIAIQVEAQGLQKKARSAANFKTKEKRKENPYQRGVRRANAYFENPPSKLIAMGVLGITSRYILLDPNVTLYGATQETIADKTFRSVSTVARSLKDVRKLQLAQTAPEMFAMKQIQAEEEGNTNGFFSAKVDIYSNKRIKEDLKRLRLAKKGIETPISKQDEEIKKKKFKITKTKVFKSSTNLYYEDRALIRLSRHNQAKYLEVTP
jgi:hypothetical protein